MWRETNLFGVLLSPFIVYVAAAGLIYALLSYATAGSRLVRRAWNPTLLGAGIYVCILGVFVTWF